MVRFRRVSAALAAALLLFSTQADVYASSHCEHHATAPAEHTEHGHHGGDAPAEQDHAVCTCLGMCAASAVAVSVRVSGTIGAFALPRDVVALISVEETVLPGFTHHLIPFATAPPAVS